MAAQEGEAYHVPWLSGRLRGAVVITMRSRPDRRAAFASHNGVALDALTGKRWSWLDAVNGKALYGAEGKGLGTALQDGALSLVARRVLGARVRRSHHEFTSLGAVGCYYSHLAAMRHLLRLCGADRQPHAAEDEAAAAEEDGDGVLLVMEDDASIARGWLKGLAEMPPPPEPWDVVTFTHMLRKASPADGSGWRAVTSLWGTQAYLVSVRGARRLLAHAFPVQSQIDGLTSDLSELGQLAVLAPPAGALPYVKQMASGASDIQLPDCPLCSVPSTWRQAIGGKAVSYAAEHWPVTLAVLLLIALALWRLRAEAVSCQRQLGRPRV